MTQRLYYGQPINWRNPLNTGLVSRWKVVPWYTSGPRLIDLAGKNHGTLTNGPAWVPGQRPGGFGAMSFVNASKRYVDCGTILLDSNNWTMMTWVYPTSFAHNTRSMAWAGDGPTLWLTVTAGEFKVVHTGTIDFDCLYAVPLNTWTHLCVTRSGSTITAYVNGRQTAQDTGFSATYTVDTAFSLGSSLSMGSGDDAWHEWLDGSLDDSCIWNRGLSPREVAEFYRDSSCGSPKTLNWIKSKAYSFQDVGGNRRRRVICGAS